MPKLGVAVSKLGSAVPKLESAALLLAWRLSPYALKVKKAHKNASILMGFSDF
jgi:hypothetical protein